MSETTRDLRGMNIWEPCFFGINTLNLVTILQHNDSRKIVVYTLEK